VSVDAGECALRPEIAAVVGAADPEARLRAYLDGLCVDGAGLQHLVLTGLQSPTRSAYTPRVEFAADASSLEGIALDGARPLGEQVHVLGSHGLRLETAGGVLRLSSARAR